MMAAVLTAAALSWWPAVAAAAAPISFEVSEGTSIAAALSPDGRQIVFDLQGALYTMPVSGGAARQIADALYDARQPSWSPDGRRIAFQSNRDGHWRIWTIGAAGESPQALSADRYDEREPSWSPDGRSIALTSTRSGKFDIWARSLADGSLRQLSRGPGGNSRASWSPDGTRVAYLSDRGAASGIYVSDLEGHEHQVGSIKIPMGGPGISPAGVPTWTPDGKEVFYVQFAGAQAQLMRGNELFLEGEDFHPFRMQWLSPREFLYTADGKIKRRSLDGGPARVIEFKAPLTVRRAEYPRKTRELLSNARHPVHGVQRAVLAPEGRRIAFTALGGLWVMEIGGKPRRLTDAGPYAVVDPAWSPDGRQLAYATDRAGSLDIWTLDLDSGQNTRVTRAPGAELRPAWSPDGRRLVYVDAFGAYTEQVHVIDLASAADQMIEAAGSSPGYPVWMPDGTSLLVSAYRPQSRTLGYLIGGENQAAIVPIDGGAARPLTLLPGRSIGNRSGDGPVISPDGQSYVYQLDAALWVQSTRARDGVFEAPRKLADLITTGQSWSADSRWLLVNAGNLLRLFDLRSGHSREITVPLSWSAARETGITTIRAGLLVDGVSEQGRADVDIVVADGRIRRIEPHGTRAPEGHYVDASGLTVMPGLMDMHSHLIKEFGARYGRLNLAYGITTVRSPGNVPGDVLEEKEALASGQRPGPNMFVTGYILDGEQTIWEMGTPVALDEVERQIGLARALDYDLIKTYMHTSEPLRQKIVSAAHAAGIPVTAHDIYPGALFGMDSSEHFFVAGSGRGYSGKVSNLQIVYDDVVQILARSQMSNAPTLSLFTPSAEMIDQDPSIAAARWALQPSWVRNGPQYSSGDVPGGAEMLANVRKSIARLHAAGARFVIGTDTPFKPTGICTHNELLQMVKAGISTYDTLRAATIVPAEVLGVAQDLGSIEVGKIADLVFVEGNPLDDIRNASKVRKVMKTGKLYDIGELTTFPVAPGTQTTQVAGQEVALIGRAGSLILPSGIHGTHGTALEQVEEITAGVEAMLAAGGLKVGDLMRHTIYLKTGAQEPSRIYTRLIANLRRMAPDLGNNPTAGTIVLVPSFPDPATLIMVEFIGGHGPKAMTRVPIMFGSRMSVESVGNEQFVASFGLEGLDFYGAATPAELATLGTLDGEMDKLVAILAANMAHAGLGIENVVSWNLYVTRGTDPVVAVTQLQHALRRRAPGVVGKPAAGSVIVLDGATLPGLKVQLNVIAARAQPAAFLRVGEGDSAESVTADGVVFLGGSAGKEGDLKTQASAVARNLAAALKHAGSLKLADVARFEIHVKQGEDAPAALAHFLEAATQADPTFERSEVAVVLAMAEGFADASTRIMASAVAARH